MTWWSGRRRRSKYCCLSFADAGRAWRVWPLRRWRGGGDSVPGVSERCWAALEGFVARHISVLVWAFRARGALFNSKSLRPIAQPGLLREPWAYEVRLPSRGLRERTGAPAPRSSTLFGLCAHKIARGGLLLRGTAISGGCRLVLPANAAEKGAVLTHTDGHTLGSQAGS